MSLQKEAVAFSKGLLNRPGQNNCFLNSAVQVLWHLDIFRRSFRELSGHTCMLDSCIFCALKELFSQLQFSHESALPPDALRRALAESFFDQQRFQLGFMDDAAECFENILLRIHFHLACGEAEDLCSAGHCIPHVKFAMTLVEQSVCGACGATSEPLPFTQMVHYVSASALISQSKQTPNPAHPDLFGQLLKKAGGMGDIRDCPSACGAKIQIRRTLTNHPEIVSVGIVWDSDRPSLEHVMSLLGTLRTSLRLTEVFHTPNPSPNMNTPHQLVGVVTYYGKHYSTFFFHTKLKVWIYFDDGNVREVGPKWEQVVDKCRRGRFQPLLLLFAAPDGSPIDSSTAPKTTTVAPTAKPPLGRRSLTPSPEKPCLATMAQRRALTPNPEQSNDTNYQRPLQVLSEYQNLPSLQKAAMWGRKDLVRRDSGNWSGDRNSASSSSSTSLENPYQYIIGKMQHRTHAVPRSPTSLKGGESSSGGSQCDPGYDSYSLSSTDSLPLQQTLKHNLQLAQIPEGHQSPVSLGNMQYPQSSGHSECERLCDEADMLLKHSQATDDLERALTFANAAVGKARQAMDAPYSNPQAASAARMKHNTCIMQARSIHKRLEEPNGPRHGEGRHSREGSGCSGRGSAGSHSRQNSKDKGNHSRQNSRELLPDPKPTCEVAEPSNQEKNIEIYATLPKSRKGLLSRATSKIKNNTVEDEEYLMYDRPGRSLSRNKPPNGKKDEKRAKSEERNSKKENQKEFISNQISKEAKKQIKAEEQKQGKKQHKIRRKLLMGGLIRRKNRSMPDLREDELPVKGVSKDDTNVGKVDKQQPSLSGYLSEGHLEYSGNPNLERSKLMRKSLHGSKLIQMAKVPPPPPLRTTSQLSKSERPQFQLPEIHHNHKENTLSLWKEPEPQSLPTFDYNENKESVTYANGGYLLNNCQTKLVITAQVHQVSSPDKEYKSVVDDDDLFDLPPYPSPLNSVTHSRQASEDFPPPPNEVETITPSSLLEQLQRKRIQILNDNDFKDSVDSPVGVKPPIKCETWLRELQAKQASIKNRDEFEYDSQGIPNHSEKHLSMSQDCNSNGHQEILSNNVGKQRNDDHTSSVKDLKSKFETITLKTHDKPTKPNDVSVEQKPRINVPSTLPARASPVINQGDIKQEQDIPLKNGDVEIKSNLVHGNRGDDNKRKPSKKKNVTFCEQVVLVATAEEDKVNSYIPNPILERVLRSVLHRDSHQETKEVAVHSVVPLKRNDSGNYGQCSARNQLEQKDNNDQDDVNAIVSAEQTEKSAHVLQHEKVTDNSNAAVPGRPFNYQRLLPSPVPNRQPGRMQVSPQLSSQIQAPYQSIPNHAISNASFPNTNEENINSNSPYISMNTFMYHPEEQYQQMSRVNGLPTIMRSDTRQISDSDMNKMSNGMQSLSVSRTDYNTASSRDFEQKSSPHMENSDYPNQINTSLDQTLLYGANPNPHNIHQHPSVSTASHANFNTMSQNAGPMSLPSSQNYSIPSQYSPLSSPSYSQASMVPPMNLIQPRTQTLSQQNPSVSQVYQQLPTNSASVQQMLHHQQYLNSNGQLINNPHSSLRQLAISQQIQNYQQPPVMQARNLPSPSIHNQVQTPSVNNAMHQINNVNNLQNNLSATSPLQHYQQRSSNHPISNNSSYQLKSPQTVPPNMHNEQQSTYITSMSQHNVPGIQAQQFLSNYPSHVQLANASLQLNNQHLANNNGTGGSNQAPTKLPAMNHITQPGQLITQTNNTPSPSLSIKSQLVLNHSQLSLMSNPNQQQMVTGVQQQSGQSCYMTLPQKMRQPLSNGNLAQVTNKSRPQGMYQPETPMQDYNQQHILKNESGNVRPDVYQRVPNILNPEAYNTSQAVYSNGPLSPTYQSPPVSSLQQGQNGAIGNQLAAQSIQAHQQAKYSPYQHPPLPRQTEPPKAVQNLNPANGRNSMCNLCRKKQILPPSIYCTDCDFYMSRFKPRT